MRCLTLLLILSLSSFAPAADKAPAPQPIAGVANALDVPYLPDRLTGRPEDRLVKLNIHYPQQGPPRPCIIFVHGGGDKDTNFHGGAMQLAVQEGFVAVNLNYILGRGLFPQVFYDFDAAVRFLRANAGQYRIDPERIGAWGFSAGGWLASSAGYSDAGDFLTRGKQGISAQDYFDLKQRKTFVDKLAGDELFAVPMEDAHAQYANQSSRLQAVAFDVAQYESLITPDDPATLSYVGEGGVNQLDAPCRAAGVDYTSVVIPGQRNRGASAEHVPNMNTPVAGRDRSGTVELRERVVDWFKQQLIEKPTAAAPEFRPLRRTFAKDVSVSVVAPSPAIKVHYTTDGSTPTAASPLFTGPLKLSATTTLKAISVRQGIAASGVATTVFARQEDPPVIIGPKWLPAAKVGQPYDISLAVEGERPAVWKLVGQIRPENLNMFEGDFQEFTSLQFDPNTATLSGKPTQPGVYTLHFQAAWALGEIPDTRSYVLVIEEE
jgi:acetyl esterase/lipase